MLKRTLLGLALAVSMPTFADAPTPSAQDWNAEEALPLSDGDQVAPWPGIRWPRNNTLDNSVEEWDTQESLPETDGEQVAPWPGIRWPRNSTLQDNIEGSNVDESMPVVEGDQVV